MNFDLPGDRFPMQAVRLRAGCTHRKARIAHPCDVPPVPRRRFDKAIRRGRNAAGCAQAEARTAAAIRQQDALIGPVAPITELEVSSARPDSLAFCAIN